MKQGRSSYRAWWLNSAFDETDKMTHIVSHAAI
jgi:hypothetical protein